MIADYAKNVVLLGPDPDWIINAAFAGADLSKNDQFSWRWLGEGVVGGENGRLKSHVFSKVFEKQVWCVQIVRVSMLPVPFSGQYILHCLERGPVVEFLRDFNLDLPILDVLNVFQSEEIA